MTIYIRGCERCEVDDADASEVSKHCWWDNKNGYLQGKIDGKVVYMHRWLVGAEEGSEVDHINGDKRDNRRCNLRFVSRSQNQWNKAACKGSTSKYKGVHWDSYAKKWRASMSWDGRTRNLGNYDTENDAARAYNEVVKSLHGEYARLNILDDEIL
jgi:hypothetical protein